MRLAALFFVLSGAVVAACSGGGGTGTSTSGGNAPGTGGDETSSGSGSTTIAGSSSGTTVTSSSSGTGGAVTSTSTAASSSGSSGGSSCATMYAPSGFKCSGATPSLAKDVAPLTTANCASSTCHSAMNSGTGVRNQLVGIIAEECSDERLLINPSNPECSYAIHKLTGTNESGCSPMTTMPLGMTMLPTSHIQTIYDWICAGAPNN